MGRKIALIGAGNIGGNLAQLASIKCLGEIVLYDLKPGLAEGKALDIAQSGALLGFEAKITGSDKIEDIRNSDAIVITAGLARKPGMSRDELVQSNYAVISDLASCIRELAPNAFVIVVTNPLDVMAWAMWKLSGLEAKKVVGMAGVLDTVRFKYFLARKMGVRAEDISTVVLGGHGDTMVPVMSCTSISGIPLQQFLDNGMISSSAITDTMNDTRTGGADIVALLKDGSAFYSPSASVLTMLRAYMLDEKTLFSCSVMAEGHYGIKDQLYVGLPCIIGADGIEKIVEIKLRSEEYKDMMESIEKVRSLVKAVKS